MARLAFETSVSPRPNLANPPPVPLAPTVTRTPEWSRMNSSATASVRGKTVEDPSTRIEPLEAGRVGLFATGAPREGEERREQGGAEWTQRPHTSAGRGGGFGPAVTAPLNHPAPPAAPRPGAA